MKFQRQKNSRGPGPPGPLNQLVRVAVVYTRRGLGTETLAAEGTADTRGGTGRTRPEGRDFPGFEGPERWSPGEAVLLEPTMFSSDL